MATQQALHPEMEERLRLNGGVLNLPPPSHKQWGANIIKWLKLGLSLEFIEHVATNVEHQDWNSSRKAKAKLLDWGFRMETHWRWQMESNLKCMKYSITFGDTGSQDWEAAVIKCYELGFSAGFVEELERRQKPYETWTATHRDRAKTLEWDFHRPLLTEKYTLGAGKSTATIVKEMLGEKGIKLSSETLNKRLGEWGVHKRTKPHAYSGTHKTDLSMPVLPRFAASATSNNALPDQAHAHCRPLPVQSSLLLSNRNFSFGPSKERGKAARSNTLDPTSEAEDAATPRHGESVPFVFGNQRMTQGCHESQLALSGALANNGSFAEFFSCEGYPDSSQLSTGTETPFRNPSDTSIGFQSYMGDIPIPLSPSHYLHKLSHQGHLTGFKPLADMSAQFPNSSLTYFDDTLGINLSENNLEGMSEPDQMAGSLAAEDIGAQFQDLSAAIKAKAQELLGIERNHTVVARELNELRNQLALLSSDPRNLASITSGSQLESYISL